MSTGTRGPTTDRPVLSASATWRSDGHLGDAALAALADGQDDALEAAARAHVASCDACAGRLADEALLSVDVGALVRAAAPEPMAQSAARPLPRLAVALALLVAIVGALPALGAAWAALPGLATGTVRALPVVARGISLLWRHGAAALGPGFVAASWAVALVAAATGLWIARRASRSAGADASAQGGVG